MKQFLLICAVISATAVLVRGSSSESESVSLLATHFLGDDNSRITDEQIKCIEDGIQIVKDSHPNLKEWFDDIDATSNRLKALGDKCRALTGLKQKLCFVKLTIITQIESSRLFGNPTEEQSDALGEIISVITECITKKQNSVAFIGSLFKIEHFGLTEEQQKCLNDGIEKINADHPDLKSWLKDIVNFGNKFKAFQKKCDALTGDAKKMCYKILEQKVKEELERLFGNLTGEQMIVLSEISELDDKCLDAPAASSAIKPSGSLDLLASGLHDQDSTCITDAQKKCIQDGIQIVKNSHPNLKTWFDDIVATKQRLNAMSDKCRARTGLRQKLCFAAFTIRAQIDSQRLFGNLTIEQELAIGEISVIVARCLMKKPSSVSFIESFLKNENFDVSLAIKASGSFDVFTFGLFDQDDTRITDEQKQCIQDGYTSVVDENPNLKSWFDDIASTSAALSDDAKQCDKLTGIPKVNCYVRLYVKTQKEYHRLFGNLTEEQKVVLEALRSIVKDCLQSNAAEDTVDEHEFFGVNTVRITEEKIKCILEGYKNVVGDNDELQEWFDEVEKTLTQLVQDVKKCEATSGLPQLTCYSKLAITARSELKRLQDQLTDEQKEILQKLVNVLKECFANDRTH